MRSDGFLIESALSDKELIDNIEKVHTMDEKELKALVTQLYCTVYKNKFKFMEEITKIMKKTKSP